MMSLRTVRLVTLALFLITIVSTYEDDTLDSAVKIVRYAVCAFGLANYYLLEFYIFRFYNICVPTETVPWCAQFSQIAYVCVCFDLLLSISTIIDKQGKYLYVELVAMIIMKVFAGTYRMMFVPNYIFRVDVLVKFRDISMVLIIYVGFMCKVLNDYNNLDLEYIIIFLPITILAGHALNRMRRKMLLDKVRSVRRTLSNNN